MICKQHNTWYRPMNVMKDKMRHQQSLLMDFQKFSRPEITFMALQALNQISDDKTKKNCPVVRVITRTSYQFVFSLFTPWQFQSSAICLVRKQVVKQETNSRILILKYSISIFTLQYSINATKCFIYLLLILGHVLFIHYKIHNQQPLVRLKWNKWWVVIKLVCRYCNVKKWHSFKCSYWC